MPLVPPTCAKCDGDMQQGFIAEYNSPGSVIVTSWVEGPPKASSWWKSIAPSEKQIPITTYRCTNCGYLESYAWRNSAQ